MDTDKKMILTVEEIKDLAQLAGFRIEENGTDEDIEIAIEACPPQGVQDDDGIIWHSRYIAYFDEYPEEGVMPLGQKQKGSKACL